MTGKPRNEEPPDRGAKSNLRTAGTRHSGGQVTTWLEYGPRGARIGLTAARMTSVQISLDVVAAGKLRDDLTALLREAGLEGT